MTHRIYKIFATSFLSALLLFSFTLPALAIDTSYVQLAPLPGTAPTCAEPPCGTSLSTYLTGMFKLGIAAAGVLAFLMIVWGGFEYLSTDAITGKEEGKARIQRALGGLVLALASYIILYTINPKLVELDLNFGPPAEQKKALNLPPPFNYEEEFNKAIAQARADRITATAASQDAQKDIEKLQREALATTDPAQKQKLLSDIEVKKAQADAVWARSAGLDGINLNRVEGMKDANAFNIQAVTKDKEFITGAKNRSIEKLEEIKTKDPANKETYDRWIADINKRYTEAITSIDNAAETARQVNRNAASKVLDPSSFVR